MKAVILAAGKGTRLTPYTEDIPKCLLKVGNKELIEFQLDALYSHNIDNITIVTGHLADKVKNKLGNRVKCIFNPLYDKTGILLSFQAAKDHLYKNEFVYLAGDIVFHPEVLKIVLDAKGDIVLGVESKECDAEDSKALINNGEVIKMGKKIESDCGEGSIAELVHIIKFSEKGSKAFFDTINEVLKKGHVNAYMMDALNLVRKSGLRLIPAYVNNYPRTEIDFLEDLKNARKMFFHLK